MNPQDRDAQQKRHDRYHQRLVEALVYSYRQGAEMGDLVSSALCEAARQVGGPEALLHRRSGSWEAGCLAQLIGPLHTFDTDEGPQGPAGAARQEIGARVVDLLLPQVSEWYRVHGGFPIDDDNEEEDPVARAQDEENLATFKRLAQQELGWLLEEPAFVWRDGYRAAQFLDRVVGAGWDPDNQLVQLLAGIGPLWDRCWKEAGLPPEPMSGSPHALFCDTPECETCHGRSSTSPQDSPSEAPDDTPPDLAGPRRPRSGDEPVHQAVLDKVVPLVLGWWKQQDEVPVEPDQVRQDLLRLLRQRGGGYNAFKAAAYLQRAGELPWQPDQALVQFLATIWKTLFECLDEVTRQWVKEQGIAPRYQVDELVIYDNQLWTGKGVPAIVREVLAETAEYQVTPLHQGDGQPFPATTTFVAVAEELLGPWVCAVPGAVIPPPPERDHGRLVELALRERELLLAQAAAGTEVDRG